MAKFLGLQSESDSLRNLDFLRLVASVGIVFLHSSEFFYSPATRDAAMARTHGLGLFVELFFIISGFVMGFVYDDRVRTFSSYLGFLWRRVARLYPLHWVVLVLNLILWAILLSQAESDTAPSFAPGCIASEAFLIQEYVDCGSQFIFNNVVWSISIEMGLYVLFPVLIFLAARNVGWVLAAVAIAIGAAFYLIQPGQEWLSTPNFARGLAGFSFGYLLFKLKHLVPDIPRADILVLGLSAVALAEMLLGAPQIVTLGTLALLAVTAISADYHGRVLPIVNKICPLGQLTYSVYIWHRLFILAFLNVVADKVFPGNTTVLIAMAALTYASIFSASYLGYLMIEVPGRRFLIGLVRSTRSALLTIKSR